MSDAALASCIRDIRQALGEQAQAPQFLETVRGRGLRFLGAVSTVPGQPPRSAVPYRPAAIMRTPRFMVGREAELAFLQSRLDSALRGARQLVFITGEPGIGKTTLIDAFLSTLSNADQALWITRGQCVEHYGPGEQYLPLLEALVHVPSEKGAEILTPFYEGGRFPPLICGAQHLEQCCRGPAGAHLVAVLRQQAPTWLAQMPWLLTPADRVQLQHELQGSTRERMLREFTLAIETLTATTPLVLVLEDWHWSDHPTLELVRS